MKIIDKKILIISAGLAGVGKTTHLKALSKEIANSVYLDKDVICSALLQGQAYFSDYYNQYVKNQSYEVMLQLARENLEENKVVILDGYFGDKLSSQRVKDLLSLPNVITKIVYFHCSGDTQFKRLQERGDYRDAEKIANGKFGSYRQEHIKKHLMELSNVPHLIIDTERDVALKANVENVLRYLQLPIPSIQTGLIDKHSFILTENEAMQGVAGFRSLLKKIKPNSSLEKHALQKKYPYENLMGVSARFGTGLFAYRLYNGEVSNKKAFGNLMRSKP